MTKKIIKKIILSASISCFTVFSAVAGEESPEHVPGSTAITATQAKMLFDQGAAFIDVRKNSDFDAGRVPGAIHIELSTLSEEALLDEVDKDEQIVIYCNGVKCLRSSAAAKSAVEWGFTQVHYFRKGLPAWKSAGYSVE